MAETEESTETTEETPEEQATTEEQPEGSEETPEETPEEEAEGKSEKSEKGKTAEQLRRELRTSDRVRKREAAKKDKEIEDLRTQLKKINDANATEQEKAIEAAKEEGRTTALAEVQKELRSERLAGAVTRLAGKGLKVGEGDDAETIKFVDRPTRVMLEQALASGDIDSADIFDDKGKVREDGLRRAVAEVLADEENLIVRPDSNGQKKTTAKSDAGEGKGSGTKSLEEMTPDEHLKQIDPQTRR